MNGTAQPELDIIVVWGWIVVHGGSLFKGGGVYADLCSYWLINEDGEQELFPSIHHAAEWVRAQHPPKEQP